MVDDTLAPWRRVSPSQARINELLDQLERKNDRLKTLEIENAELQRENTVLRREPSLSAHARMMDPALSQRHELALTVLQKIFPEAESRLTVSGRVAVELTTYEVLVARAAGLT